MKQTKENLIEKCSEYLKKMWPLITATLFPMTDWVIKLYFSQEAESKYGIPEKYFFSYNYRKNIYMSIFFLLYSITFFLIYKVDINKNKKIVKNIYSISIIYLQSILIIGIGILIISSIGNDVMKCIIILVLLLLLFFNIYYNNKYYNKKEKLEKLGSIHSIIFLTYFILTFIFLNNSFSSLKKYELFTKGEKENFVVLSEYEDKYLVVPYLKKNDNYKINDKKSKCENEYCFFTKYYRLIDKNE